MDKYVVKLFKADFKLDTLMYFRNIEVLASTPTDAFNKTVDFINLALINDIDVVENVDYYYSLNKRLQGKLIRDNEFFATFQRKSEETGEWLNELFIDCLGDISRGGI